MKMLKAGMIAALIAVAQSGSAHAQNQGNEVPLALASDKVGTGPRLVYLFPDYPFTLDPQNGSSFANPLALQFFDTLVTYEMDFKTMLADQTKIVPRLAESWNISSDNKSLTFKLNKAARFWDGSPVTADDVYFSFERALKGRMGWGTTQIESGGVRSVDQIRIVDPLSIEFTFPDGMNRYALRNFATISTAIISKSACQKSGDANDPWCVQWIKRNAMGSGPYMLGDFRNGEFLVARANKNYWRDLKPHYAEIMFRVVPDVQSRLLLMQSGEANFAVLTPKEHEALANHARVKVYTAPRGQDVAVMRWKVTQPPFDDMAIRDAVIKAIPYDRLIADVCRGFCTRVKNLVGVDTVGYREEPMFTTDIEAARKLVAGSKYAGKVPSFEVILADSSAHMGAAVIIQDTLRQIGLDMQIKPVSGPAFDDIAWKQRALNVSIHSMGPWWNDFMYWAYWMYRSDSATNHIRYQNADLDTAVVKALLVPQDQPDAYLELQKPILDMMLRERLAAPLYQVNWSLAASKEICNINRYPWAQVAFEYLRPCR